MNLDESYWGRLINYWVKVRRRNGLSIPFIIGARTLIDNNFRIDSHSVADLLSEIIDSNGDEIIILQHCEDIGEYVLGLNDPYNPKDGLLVKNNGEVRIIATLNTRVLGEDFDIIKESLTERYKACLSSGMYSRDNFKWNAFSYSDLKMIEEAFKNKY